MSNPTAIRQRVTEKMESSLEHLKRDLAGLRTGRASVALFDGVRVDYYGTMTPLKQVANISTPEARLITIQPWEPALIKEIEKAQADTQKLNDQYVQKIDDVVKKKEQEIMEV